MRPLVLLGSTADPHLGWIRDAVRAAGDAEVHIVDHATSRIQLDVDAHGAWDLRIDGMEIARDFVVFDRAKLQLGSPFYVAGDDPAQSHTRAFVADEWNALHRLICSLASRVLNPLEARSLLTKPYQQIVAAACGLLVPETCVSNDKAALLKRLDGWGGQGVMKSLSGAIIRLDPADDRDNRVFMTTAVTRDELAAADGAEVGIIPNFLQAEIVKSFELRLVWVDGRQACFDIDSQRYETTRLDWRYSTSALEFGDFALPATVAAQVDRFMERIGLFCGSLDFIVDTDGRYWFLECNQQGAWGWLDGPRDGRIARMFADGIVAVLAA